MLYLAQMKISIIVPITGDQTYLANLRSIIKESVPATHVAELILVKEFDPDGLGMVAEKPEAQLYIFHKTSLSQKFEAGAFEATGDIYYFLMPGYLPPLDFAIRIIRACVSHKELGTLSGKWTVQLFSFLPFQVLEKIFLHSFSIDNLMISRNLFRKLKGLRWDGKDRKLSYLLTNELTTHQSSKFIH